jgi:hypothetical protein
MRGYYLRNKDNIAQYIKQLREEKLSDLQIDKGFIQSQLVSEIEYMNEEGDSSKRNVKLKAIELLGKTIPGTFTDTIQIEEVSPDKALDTLLDMAKAEVKELPKGSKTQEKFITIDV